MFIVRPALAEDVPAMHQLILELAIFEKAPNEVVATEHTLYHALFSPSSIAIAWVTEQNSVITGMAICYLRYSTWKGTMLYLEDLIVSEPYRGHGMGKALLEKCFEYARERGYPRVIWQVLDWNTPAIEFYKRYCAEFDSGWVNAWVNVSKLEQ
jgi:ribosomal protein S18 acetylase RimI-like enzyme